MSFATFALTSLVLCAGPVSAAQSPKAFDPFFDYKTLPPENEDLWSPLQASAVTMQDALALALESEGPETRPGWIELRVRPKGSVWYLELFVGAPDVAKPKRVNLQVSTSEKKIQKRFELSTLAPDEEKTWTVLRKAAVTCAISLDLGVEKSKGDNEEARWTEARIRTARFVPVATAPIWELELLALDPKHESAVRRVAYQINAEQPRVKRFILMDRFPGEPLRNKGKAVQREDGLYVHDFVVGDGQEIARGTKVKVNYRLFLLDGQKIHDTWFTKLAETFQVDQAPLKGMTEGMVGMRVGGRRKIAMPAALAFGSKGNELAPPDAMIVCDVAIEEVAP
ncbi:MAG: FKBP-type peptidyl-prolyl cis-trans isomerase [Planctomycetota bacterium]